MRLLHLQHVHPTAVQRGLLGEGMLFVAVLLTLADLTSAWLLLVLPLSVAVVVKLHDVVAGQLRRSTRPVPSPERGLI